MGMAYAATGMRVRVLLALAATVGGLAAGAAPALASSNTASTLAYLQANYALVRVARAHLGSSENGPLEVLAQVRRECPGVGAGSPQDAESTEMSDEVIGAIVIAADRPDAQAIEAFIRAASALRWSSASLTRAVHEYVGKLKTVLSLPAPNLCVEVRGWATSGYKQLPASTTSFVARFMPAWVALGFLTPQLSRYENATAKALAGSSAPLETALTEGEARAVERWGAIMDTLDLWP